MALPWENARLDDSNDTLKPKCDCEFQAGHQNSVTVSPHWRLYPKKPFETGWYDARIRRNLDKPTQYKEDYLKLTPRLCYGVLFWSSWQAQFNGAANIFADRVWPLSYIGKLSAVFKKHYNFKSPWRFGLWMTHQRHVDEISHSDRQPIVWGRRRQHSNNAWWCGDDFFWMERW